MEDIALCFLGKLWKVLLALMWNLKIKFFRINRTPCWVIYSRMWKQTEKGRVSNSTFPSVRHKERTVAVCSQGGLVPVISPHSAFSHLSSLPPSFLPSCFPSFLYYSLLPTFFSPFSLLSLPFSHKFLWILRVHSHFNKMRVKEG